MNLHTTLPKSLHPYFQSELEEYTEAYKAGDLTKAWAHLERAHIIGQQYPFAHTFVHWKMLQFGFRIKSGKEVFGQIPCLIVGGIKSFGGTVPVGNPGGANVPPMKSFPIATDIQAIFIKAGLEAN